MRKTTLDIGTLHFVGIGGIGMSGIAELLNGMGYTVQGSDISDNANVKRLRAKGISVFVGHDAAHIEGAGAIVVSSAIKKDNPELIAARAAKIPVVKRADMLAELMRFKTAIAVGGTHGKTTTTSIIGTLLEEGGLDPTVVNGGIIHAYGTNTRQGASEWMVVESDESDGTFTRLPATIAVVTNIDPEHMEHYGDFDAVKDAYRQFVENIPFYGFAVLCLDHPEVQALLPQITDRRVITYGMSAQAQVRATNLRASPTGTTFDVTMHGETWTDLFLQMPGAHNVQNALSAIAIGQELGLTETQVKKALRTFQGVKRRFTKTGEAGGVTVIDDYGHHPVEISAVLKAARQMVEGTSARIIAVAQPHRYSRLSDLMNEFATCFNEADTVFIADVYAAGESPIEGVSAESLVERLSESGHNDARYLKGGAENLPDEIATLAQSGDFVICLGAGDITAWAAALPEALEKLNSKANRNAL